MTPEELNRKMEFIIETQAHLSASLDREHGTREERLAEFEKTQRNLAKLQTQVVDMIRIESDRLDRQDKWIRESQNEWQRWQSRADLSQKTTEEFQREALRLLYQILDKVTKNNPNQN